MKNQPKNLLATLVLVAGLIAGCSEDAGPGGSEVAVRIIELPAAPGSMVPNLERAPDGSLVLSWIEPAGDASALRFAVFDGAAWSDARTVVTGDNWFENWADFPSVVPVTDKLWGAHWLVRREAGGYAYDIHAAISTDAGSTWSEPFLPHKDNTDTEHGFVSMFEDDGRIGMVWLDGRKFVNEVTDDKRASAMTLRSATFAPDGEMIGDTVIDDMICDCCQTDATRTGTGIAAVYRDRTEAEIRDIYVARRIEGTWADGAPVGKDGWEIPGCPVNGPVIEAHPDDANRVAVLWFSAANNAPMVSAAFSSDGAQTFGGRIVVDVEKPLGHVAATMLPDGDLVAAWQRGDRNGHAQMLLRRISSDGTSGAPFVVGAADGVFSFSVPQLEIIEDALLLVWTTRNEDDGYAIHGARLPLSLIP